MNSKPELRVDWCSFDAAKHAVENWHYSHTMPAGKLVRLGAWEAGRFVGCVLFGRGASSEIGSPYGLKQTEVCELVRVALTDHVNPVSRILAVALRMLKKQSPGLRLIVSYADSDQRHHGGIYQAGNWLFVASSVHYAFLLRGKVIHSKSVGAKYGTQSLGWLKANVDRDIQQITPGPKYKYLMPLDDEMRAKLKPLAKPYPKKRVGSSEAAPGVHPGEGGATPTPTLQKKAGRAN